MVWWLPVTNATAPGKTKTPGKRPYRAKRPRSSWSPTTVRCPYSPSYGRPLAARGQCDLVQCKRGLDHWDRELRELYVHHVDGELGYRRGPSSSERGSMGAKLDPRGTSCRFVESASARNDVHFWWFNLHYPVHRERPAALASDGRLSSRVCLRDRSLHLAERRRNHRKIGKQNMFKLNIDESTFLQG